MNVYQVSTHHFTQLLKPNHAERAHSHHRMGNKNKINKNRSTHKMYPNYKLYKTLLLSQGGEFCRAYFFLLLKLLVLWPNVPQ